MNEQQLQQVIEYVYFIFIIINSTLIFFTTCNKFFHKLTEFGQLNIFSTCFNRKIVKGEKRWVERLKEFVAIRSVSADPKLRGEVNSMVAHVKRVFTPTV